MRAIGVPTLCLLLALAAAGCSNDSTTSPSSTTTTTSPVTDTFASLLARGGATTRSFAVSSAGTVKLTLSTLGNGTVTAGLSIGLPATGAPCSPSVSVVTGPGSTPQLQAAVEAGTYCAQIFDTGTLKEDTAFSITIEHP
ncbi:MAG: hypothetical protein U0Q55_06575 [Vicinamibacterales bacterium]